MSNNITKWEEMMKLLDEINYGLTKYVDQREEVLNVIVKTRRLTVVLEEYYYILDEAYKSNC